MGEGESKVVLRILEPTTVTSVGSSASDASGGVVGVGGIAGDGGVSGGAGTFWVSSMGSGAARAGEQIKSASA